ncbi:class I SAM-dependent methyltransferase [Segnochrobactraceae bacterium EtOH-i3]
MVAGTGLSGVASTLVVTLAARAQAHTVFPHLGFRDPASEELVRRLEIRPDEIVSDRDSVYGVLQRSQLFDAAVRTFAKDVGTLTVIELGCGLSTAVHRVGTASSAWIEVDQPKVTELRRRACPPDSHRRSVSAIIGAPGWLDEIPLPDDGPVLLMAEGIVPYLTPKVFAGILGDLALRLKGRRVRFVYDAFAWPLIGMARFHPSIGPLARRDREIEFRSGVSVRADYTAGDPRWRLTRVDSVLGGSGRSNLLGIDLFEMVSSVPLYGIATLDLVG